MHGCTRQRRGGAIALVMAICGAVLPVGPGYANGGNKFDLTKWDPAYFERLRDFVGEAGKRGIVVEMVLFCPFYKDQMWRLSPMNAANNVNGIGKMARTEVSGPGSELGKEYWYGFSIFLPQDYVKDDIWEIVAQWHGVPDFKVGENWRNPVMALSTDGGKWQLVNRWDAKLNTFQGGKRSYGGTRHYDLGEYRRGAWTDWVVHVKWSYRDDGLLEVWKNGVRIVEQKGPNAFNDSKGPYFKMGIYKGWRDPGRKSDAVSSRLLYHDEFRMAGADACYDDVAPPVPVLR